jgi:hypothetical protein
MKRLLSITSATTFLLAAVLSISAAETAGVGQEDICVTGNRFAAHAEKMKAMLKLSNEQAGLLDSMHRANVDLNTKACPGNASGCIPARELTRAFHLFRAELAAENPDFHAIGDRLKSEYQGKYKEEFDKAIDARVAFMSTLTPEQRESMMKMGHRRHRSRAAGCRQP